MVSRSYSTDPDILLTAHEVYQRPVTVNQLLGARLQSLQISVQALSICSSSGSYLNSCQESQVILEKLCKKHVWPTILHVSSPLLAAWVPKLAWVEECDMTSRWRELSQPPAQHRPLYPQHRGCSRC